MQYKITKEALENAMEVCTTRKDLAKYFKVSLSTISRSLKKYNLSTFKASFELNEFMKLYNQGFNDAKIAILTKKSRSAVSRFRIKNNLKSNFKYEYEKIEEEIINLKNENLTELEIANELNLDLRVVNYFLYQKNNLESLEELNDEQYQIFLGSMLGDGNINLNRSGNLGRHVFAHSEKQKEYCIWKSEKFMNICYHYRTFKEKQHYDNRTDKIYKSYFCYSHDKIIFKKYFEMWYNQINGKNVKHIPIKELYNLNSLGIAVWFMDDGYMHKGSYYISTNCFSKEEIICIQIFFKIKYNINTTIQSNNILYIKSNSKEIFLNLIKNHIHNDCVYKIESL